MQALQTEQTRQISGGRWKCKTCGKKFWLYIQAVTHCNCEAHYNNSIKPGGWVKWCF